MNSAKTRRYVHGDSHEDNIFSFFCAQCDEFAPREHFDDAKHVAGRAHHYNRSLTGWHFMNKWNNGKGVFFRPEDSHNILQALAAEDVAAEIASRSPFYRWLLKQASRDDAVGDFAKDAKRVDDFPTKSTSLDEIRWHLFEHRACDEAIEALETAWAEFTSKARARSPLPVSLRFDVLQRDEYKCCICGTTAKEGSKLEIDHKIAVAKGGSNLAENLWTLCFDCNRGKGVKPLNQHSQQVSA